MLLRGNISGRFIVGDRAWYEREKIAKGRLWKLMHQSNDRAALWQMAMLGNDDKNNPDRKQWPEETNKC